MIANPYRGADLLWAGAIAVSLLVHAGVAVAVIRLYDPFGGAVTEKFNPPDLVVSLLAPGDGELNLLGSAPIADSSPHETAESVAPNTADTAEAEAAVLAQAETLQPTDMAPDEESAAVEPQKPDSVDAREADPLTSIERLEAATPDTLDSIEEAATIDPTEPTAADTLSEPEAVESVAAEDIDPAATLAPNDTDLAVEPEVLEAAVTPDAPEAEDAAISQPQAPLAGIVKDVAVPVAIATPLGISDVAPSTQSIPKAAPVTEIASVVGSTTVSAQTVITPIQAFTQPTDTAPSPPATNSQATVPDAANVTPSPPAAETALKAQSTFQAATTQLQESLTPNQIHVAQTERLLPRVMIPKPRARAASGPSGSGGTTARRSDDPTVRRLIALIRGNFSDACLLAIPKRTEQGSLLLLAFGARETALRDLSDTVKKNLGAPILTRTHLVNTRQCPALRYLRESPGYPTFNLSIELAQPQIESGAVLQGFLNNAAGRHVTFLLVDDNGVVQDLGEYLRYSNGRIKFAIPMRRSGANRDTSQLLVVVASRTRPDGLASLIGRRAEDFFPALKDKIGMSNLVAVLPFDIN